jgi:hypothetical protein
MLFRNLFTSLFTLITVCALSQAVLPTAHSFDGSPLPVGWTLNLNIAQNGITYTSGSDSSPSCRLDASGEYVQIHYATQAGALSYYIRSTGINPVVANGTLFHLQESVNGITWTNIRQFDVSNLTGSFVQFTDQPAAASRYIRFYYTNKASGSNIALDQILLQEAAPGPNAAIKVKYNTQTLLNGGTVFIGNSSTHIFTIENNGTAQTLNINSYNISGLHASDFIISGMPANISPQTNANFTLTFTAGANGSRYSTITINNNDSQNDPFIIYINAIGGTLASEPLTQPSNLSFTNIKAYTFNVNFNAASPSPDGYLVLWKKDLPVTEIPTDGVSYNIGDQIGQAKVAYVGNANTFIPRHVVANSNYYFKIFSYNGSSGFENYLTANALSGQVLSSGQNIGNYYNGINRNNLNLVSQLTNKINPHTQIYYGSYSNTIVDNFESYDTSQGRKVLPCLYSNYRYVYNEPFVYDTMSREHVFAHSWFPTNPAQNNIEYSDLFNLFPAKLQNVNMVRSNYPFGIVVNTTYQYMDGKLGQDINGNTVYEPANHIKGNVARAIFYMLTCYNGTGGAWNLPTFQNQQILKTWHQQDPPDNYEIARNEYIYALQGNRNPFIDSAVFACFIDFSTMSKITNPPASCLLLNSPEITKESYFHIYPNPSSDILNIYTANINAYQNTECVIFDIYGKLIYTTNITNQHTLLDLSLIPEGLYILQLASDHLLHAEKIIIAR